MAKTIWLRWRGVGLIYSLVKKDKVSINLKGIDDFLGNTKISVVFPVSNVIKISGSDIVF